MHSLRLVVALTAISALLLPAERADAQRMSPRTIKRLKVTLTMPDAWKEDEEGSKVDRIRFALPNAAVFHLGYHPAPKKLDELVKRLNRRARELHWRVRTLRKTRLGPRDAVALEIDVTSQDKNDKDVETRQLFYFVNAKYGHYIMHFAAPPEYFDRGLFLRVVRSFRVL